MFGWAMRRIYPPCLFLGDRGRGRREREREEREGERGPDERVWGGNIRRKDEMDRD
jgi:hypothetical protein